MSRNAMSPAEFEQAEPPWQIWQPEPFFKMVDAWAAVLPERSKEIATVRQQVATAEAPPASRQRTACAGWATAAASSW